ncbi:hypothetical protein M0D21_04275 [Aquimarina sp. D1M17]|uniref:hypothetical protein n=1 Tax=Aquimarina acroporae TaxID=2937283 RepID=UPI0020BD8397|nr:hypothetical protein [Aquimarina acroporae]MCK8520765.1 hypothetical protein [Aquimarina acroporae]
MKTNNLRVVYNHSTGFEIKEVETQKTSVFHNIDVIQYVKLGLTKFYKGLQELGSGAGYSLRH